MTSIEKMGLNILPKSLNQNTNTKDIIIITWFREFIYQR